MSLTSEATSDELTSPYYIRNKDLSEAWEEFILGNGGKINGSYSVWAILLKAKVSLSKTWLVEIKKATYSSDSLLLSSKYQSLQEILTFQTKITNTSCKDFYIKNAIHMKGNNTHPFYKSIVALLINELKENSLREIKYEHQILTIIVHHKNDDFALAKRILKFELPNID